MNIIVLNTHVPFESGGAEYLADGLVAQLIKAGHDVELVRVPFWASGNGDITRQMLMSRLLRLGDKADLVIPLKFPVYYVPFEHKKVWLLHQYRQFYDLWGTEYQGHPSSLETDSLKTVVARNDGHHLGGMSDQIWTISKKVANRLTRYNGIVAKGVLYPPLNAPELFTDGDYGDYLFYPSRLNPTKRQALAIEAMRYVKSPFKLVLAGTDPGKSYQAELDALIAKYSLQNKVQFVGRVTEQEKADYMSNAFGSVFLPYDEDYGIVTIEAFQAHKAVITASDAGGPLELVRDGDNGFVSEPNAKALAEAMERLYADRKRCREMGQRAFATMKELKIEWDHIIETLAA